MSALISISVGLISLLCMAIIFFVLSSNVTSIVQSQAVGNMTTALEGQTNLIEQFVADSELLMKEYATSADLKKLLSDPENPEYIAAAQSYTEKFFSNLDEWEGVYLSDWNTKVLAHSSPNAVGMVTRKGDALDPYRQTMTSSKNGFYNGGAFVSPASKQLILNLRMAIYDDSGNPIGLVGGGPFLSGLNRTLAKVQVAVLENEQYAILDSVNKIYTYNSNNDLITQPVEDETMLKIMELVAGGSTDGVLYEGTHIISYRNIPQVNLIVTMQDETSELLRDSSAVQKQFILYICIAELVIIIATIAVAKILTNPLKKVTSAVNDLGELSLKTDDKIKSYAGKSEVGEIAKSVSTLTVVWKNIIETLTGCSADLGKASEEMLNTMGSLSECASDNAESTQKLSSDVVTATEAIQKVDGDIGQINVILSESRNANLERISSAKEMITNAEGLYTEVAAKSEKTQNDINNSIEYLNALSDINNNVKIIQSIAEKTHLLAINASIEASRAGAAGKGFAVVASEIKNLSENSSSAANAISDVCKEMNSNIDNIKGCFDEIISFMHEDILAIFKDMREISDSLKKSMEDANRDLDEMAEIIGNIKGETSQLSGVISDNERYAESINEKTGMTRDMIHELDELIEKNKQAVKNINEIVSRFER